MRLPPQAWTFSIHTPRAGSGSARPGNGVWNIVKLQIEEYFETQPVQPLHDCGTGRGEQLHPDLDSETSRIDLHGHCERFVLRRKVQRNDDSRAARKGPVRPRSHSPSTPWMGLIEVQCLQLGHCQCSDFAGNPQCLHL